MLFLLVLAFHAACSPSTPSRCGDGPFLPDYMGVTCTASGPVVNCLARTEGRGSYCNAAPADATNAARWFSTNPSSGVFTRPGRFEFTASGATVLYAGDSRLASRNAMAYSFEVGGTIRGLHPFEVIVHDAAGRFLPMAEVEFRYEGGGQTQTCRQDIDPPQTRCLFGFDGFDDRVLGPGEVFQGVVVASKHGYSTLQRSVALRPTCAECSPFGTVLRLSPSP